MKTCPLLRLVALWFLASCLPPVVLAQVPQLLHYQGRAIVSNTNFEGTGQFKFALVNAAGNVTYWSNDGSSTTGNQPTAGVSLPVAKGLYAVLLGDTNLASMTAVPASVFTNPDVRLRVWFNDGAHGYQQVAPDQRIAAVGYAMVAGSIANGTISGSSLRVEGTGGEAAYLGGDGNGNDVEVGSNPAVQDVVLYNLAASQVMNLIAGGVVLDGLNQNTGSVTHAALRFAPGSGEGIASKRDGGGTQYGLELFTGLLPRLSILNNGDVGIGNEHPTAKLDVAGTVEMDGLKLNGAPPVGALLTATDSGGGGGWNSLLVHEPVRRGSSFQRVDAVNIRSGGPGNTLGGGVFGATLIGGGRQTHELSGPNLPPDWPNRVNADFATLVGGANNSADGSFSFVAGGFDNRAGGDYSFAAGSHAHANHQGAFVWADSQIGDFDSTANNQFLIRAAGGVGIGTTSPQAALDVAGTIRTCVITITGGCDLAEPFPVREEDIPKGSVVVIDEEHPGRLMRSSRAYDRRVAGIISGANGVNPGITLKQEGALADGQNVALTGRVYVLADAATGAIKPGDLLTTSNTPGHAMRVADYARAPGAVLGKAMSALTSGQGMVLVLVSLQ